MPNAAMKLADIAAARPRNRDGSAQGLLLVLLGLFLWRQPPVRTAVVIAALETLGISENAARKAIHRLSLDGIAAATREGREAWLSVGPAGEALFERGAEQVFGFGSTGVDWDGRWLVLMVSVPDSQRMTRHYLQSRLAWLGMGSPAPGTWISPHADVPVHPVIERLELTAYASSWVGAFGPVGDEAAMVRQAWDIEGLAALYRDFIDKFAKLAPKCDADCFIADAQLVQAWRRFPFLDPRLPARFLPEPWIGREAAAVMRERRAAWGAPAQRFWDVLKSR